MFEINSDPFYYPSDNNEDRENKLDSESKVQERAAEDVSVESRPVQVFYCDLCVSQPPPASSSCDFSQSIFRDLHSHRLQ